MLQARFHRNFRNYKKSLQSPLFAAKHFNEQTRPSEVDASFDEQRREFFVRSEPHTSRQHENQRSLLISKLSSALMKPEHVHFISV